MALLQRQPQQLLDQRAKPDAGEPGQPTGQFGIEQPGWREPDLGQALEVLAGRVQYPLGTSQCGREGRQLTAEGYRVDQRRARAGPPQLDEIGAL